MWWWLTWPVQAAPRSESWIVVRFDDGAPLGTDGLPTDPELRRVAERGGVVRYTPVFPPGAGRAAPEAFVASGLGRVHRGWLEVPGSVEAALEAHRGARGISSVYPDPMGWPGAAPSDPYLAAQWSLNNDGTFSGDAVPGADVSAFEAWALEPGGEIVVAVLDSGVTLAEPDLANRLWTNPGEVAGNGRDDDGNGYVDDVDGWDFSIERNDPSDDSGHGTNVAGVIAAERDNGIGYAGLCDSCRIMPLKNLGDGGYGYYTWWAASIVYAVDQGATVLNMSEYGASAGTDLFDGVAYAQAAGAVIVACAGNTGDDTPGYPAAFEGVISVGATNDADLRADPFSWGGGSTYGATLDLVAPGDSIYGLSLNAGVYDWVWSGTSQATPHVAAVAAMLRGVDGGFTAEDVERLLEEEATDRVGAIDEDLLGWDRFHGAGRLDARASLERAWSADDDLDGDGWSWRDGDCDDDLDATFPGADERCDVFDNDCDGDILESFPDADGDGVPDCATDVDGDGFGEDDCDDTDPDVFPGAQDVAGDGLDQDCSGRDAVTCGEDADGDGFGAAATVPEDEDCDDPGEAAALGDCDDGDPAVYPEAPEACGEERDCDGVARDCAEKSVACGCGSASGGAPGLVGLAVLMLGFRSGRRHVDHA